jgi:hypothetical protein
MNTLLAAEAAEADLSALKRPRAQNRRKKKKC